MSLLPTKNYILAQIIAPQNKTASGLILPDTSKSKITRASVSYSHNENYSYGDHIFYEKFRDLEIQDEDGTNFVLINEDYIVAKIKQ